MSHCRIFVCIGGRCAPYEEADRLQRSLQKLCEEGDEAPIACIRTGCLRICAEGPLVVVDPGDYVYANVDLATAKRIVAEHLGGGVPLREKLFDPRKPGQITGG